MLFCLPARTLWPRTDRHQVVGPTPLLDSAMAPIPTATEHSDWTARRDTTLSLRLSSQSQPYERSSLAVATESRLGLKTLTLKQYRRRLLSATAAVLNSDSDVSRHGGVVGLLLSGVAVALWRLRRQWTQWPRTAVRSVSYRAWREPWRQCMDVLTETGDLPLDGHRLLCGR